MIRASKQTENIRLIQKIFKLLFPEPWTDREVMYIAYIGNLFLRMLKALILPLIIPSLIAAVGSLDTSLSGKVTTIIGHL